MKKRFNAKLVLIVLLCGIGMTSAQAQNSTTSTTGAPTSGTTISCDGVTGTDPVPTSPNLTDIILTIVQAIM